MSAASPLSKLSLASCDPQDLGHSTAKQRNYNDNADTHSELTTCQAPVSFTWINSTLKQLIYYTKDKEAETPRCEVTSSRLTKSTRRSDFSCRPGIKTPPSRCRGPGLNSCSGEDPTCRMHGRKKKKKVHGGPRTDPRGF